MEGERPSFYSGTIVQTDNITCKFHAKIDHNFPNDNVQVLPKHNAFVLSINNTNYPFTRELLINNFNELQVLIKYVNKWRRYERRPKLRVITGT